MGQDATTSAVAATTGATVILGANPDATFRRIIPSGTVFLGVAGVTTATGFRLQATDPAFIMQGSGFNKGAGIYTGPIWAVATTTGSTIFAFET
jgi:hypothetical protein